MFEVNGVKVYIIEYVFVVLYGIGVDNVFIIFIGFEILIMDGSFIFFVWKINEVGMVE